MRIVKAFLMQEREEAGYFTFLCLPRQNDLPLSQIVKLQHLRMTVTMSCVSEAVDLRTVEPLAMKRNSENPSHDADAMLVELNPFPGATQRFEHSIKPNLQSVRCAFCFVSQHRKV